MDRKVALGLVLTLILVVFIPVYWMNEPARQKTASARQQGEAVARGVEEYTERCAACHGDAGQGVVGPALKGTALSEDALERIIVMGTPGGMPSWGEEAGGPLKAHQIRDLVTLIKNWDDSLLK